MTFEPTREELRALLIEHRSIRAVAEALGWGTYRVKTWLDLYEIPHDWKKALTTDEIYTVWNDSGCTVQHMARGLDVAPRTARKMLARIGVTPKYGRRKRKPRERVPYGWPSLDKWRSPLLDDVAVG